MEIQIVLTTDNSFFSRLARLLGAEYTHCMLRFPVLWECAWTGVWGMTQSATRPDPIYRIIEATMRRGVIERQWNPERYSNWAVYRLKEPLADFQYARILGYARGNKGKRYAFEGLALIIPRFFHRYFSRFTHERWEKFDTQLMFIGTGQICTSLVDDCFCEALIDLVPDIDTPWVLPDDLRDSPLLELLPPEGTVEWRGEA